MINGCKSLIHSRLFLNLNSENKEMEKKGTPQYKSCF
jgi:hypothetical protein